MIDELVHIFNYNTQNYPSRRLELLFEKRLNTQPNKLTNQNSLKVPKVFNLTNKKTLL